MKLRTLLFSALAIVATAVLAVQAQVPGVNSTLNAVFTLAYDNSTMKPTYSASRAGVVPASSATDICLLNGSATKNIRLRRVIVGGIAASAISEPVSIIKRSTAPVGGASTLIPAVAYDSVNSLTGGTNTATAIADIYTTNPTTPGTLVGVLADVYVFFGATTSVNQIGYTFAFGALGSPVVLRGAAQSVAVNLSNITYTGGQLSCTFEWTEE